MESYEKALEIDPDQVVVFWYNRACSNIKKRKIEETLAALKKAIELDSTCIESAKQDKDFDSIRNDERFKALIARGKTNRNINNNQHH